MYLLASSRSIRLYVGEACFTIKCTYTGSLYSNGMSSSSLTLYLGTCTMPGRLAGLALLPGIPVRLPNEAGNPGNEAMGQPGYEASYGS